MYYEPVRKDERKVKLTNFKSFYNVVVSLEKYDKKSSHMRQIEILPFHVQPE